MDNYGKNRPISGPGADRSTNRPPLPEGQRLILFAYYLVLGYKTYEAYVTAGFVDPDVGFTSAELALHEARAEELFNDPRTATLIRACRSDPRILLHGAQSMAVVSLLDLGFNHPNPHIRLKALKEIMDRGGLPAQTVQLTGSSSDLEKLSNDELRAEVVKLLLG